MDPIGEAFARTMFLLILAHAVTDFALQSPAMSSGKSGRHSRPQNVPEGQKPMAVWFYWLTAHALVNAAGVYVVTQRIDLAVLEACAHWVIDFIKCENLTNPHTDQGLHFLTKLIEAHLLVAGILL